MQAISAQLEDLRHKIMGQPYVTPAENTLADDLASLIDIVGAINNRLDRVESLAAGPVGLGP